MLKMSALALFSSCGVPVGAFIGVFVAYVSKVDNLSGDAEFLPAIPSSPFVCE